MCMPVSPGTFAAVEISIPLGTGHPGTARALLLEHYNPAPFGLFR